jgi:hypothetical protein
MRRFLGRAVRLLLLLLVVVVHVRAEEPTECALLLLRGSAGDGRGYRVLRVVVETDGGTPARGSSAFVLVASEVHELAPTLAHDAPRSRVARAPVR